MSPKNECFVTDGRHRQPPGQEELRNYSPIFVLEISILLILHAYLFQRNSREKMWDFMDFLLVQVSFPVKCQLSNSLILPYN